MKIKIVRSKGCMSAVVDEKSYFSTGKGKLKGKVYTIPEENKKK